MPPNFCLLPKAADEFTEKIRSGALDPAALAKLPSAARRAALAEVVGDANAEHVNAAFESKLLLKNQQEGLKTWIRDVSGAKPAIQRDMLARVGRMEKVLEPKDLDSFLADLAKQKLGVGVTMDEAGRISDLAKTVAEKKAAGDWDGYMDARLQFREYVAGLEGHGPMTPAKAMVAFARGAALSFPTTLLKLTGVALSRVVTTPLEDAVGMGVANALPGLADGAPRFGTTSPAVAVKAEAAAQAAMWTDGLVDAGRMLRNKASRLDLMHDDHAQAHAWYEYMGSLHGALKEPIKRAEYARSLYRRTAEAASRGEDITDMTVKLRLSTEAFKDGQRAISMQDNIVAKGWNGLLKQLEAPNKETGKQNPAGVVIATALRSDVPVMKAPSNIIAEASQYIGGILTGPAKAAYAYAHGIEDLKPIERDAIIREISKGSIGAAIMGLYYFKHQDVQFGGYYQPGEHRAPTDVQADGLRVFGHDVPKQLIHHPMFQAAQFAATTARVSGSKLHAHDQDPQGLASAVGAAAVGLIDQVPIIGSLPKDLHAVSDPSTRGEFASKKAAQIAVPGLVQWIAKAADPATEPRKPTGLTEHLEANIPGLREKVPLKSTVDAAKKERQRQARADANTGIHLMLGEAKAAGPDNATKFDALVHGAFADSLTSITGAPSAFVHGIRTLHDGSDRRGVYGEYAGALGRDTVFITNSSATGAPIPSDPSQRRASPEFVLAHELAHRFQADRAPKGTLARAPQDSVFQDPGDGAASGYWGTSEEEHYSEAFANAVTFLRATGREHADAGARARSSKLLASYEHEIPGTTLMIKALLNQPVYARHPLNQAAQQPPTPADATAVRTKTSR